MFPFLGPGYMPQVTQSVITPNPVYLIELAFLRTRLPVLMLIQRTIHISVYNRLHEDEPCGSKHVADINKLKY